MSTVGCDPMRDVLSATWGGTVGKRGSDSDRGHPGDPGPLQLRGPSPSLRSFKAVSVCAIRCARTVHFPNRPWEGQDREEEPSREWQEARHQADDEDTRIFTLRHEGKACDEGNAILYMNCLLNWLPDGLLIHAQACLIYCKASPNLDVANGDLLPLHWRCGRLRLCFTCLGLGRSMLGCWTLRQQATT